MTLSRTSNLATALGFLAVFGGAVSLTSCAHADQATRISQPDARSLSRPARDLVLGAPGSERADAALSGAVQLATRACMARHDLMYRIPKSRVQMTPYRISLPEFPQTYVLAARKRSGYGLFRPPGHRTRRASAVKSQARSSQHYYLLLDGQPNNRVTVTIANGIRTGLPVSGCFAEARTSVYGSVGGYLKATTGVSVIRLDLLQAVQSANAYRDLLRPWSKCMRNHGYAYSSPADAYGHLASAYSAGTATAGLRKREITTAVTDYWCATKVSLVTKVIRLQEREVSRMPTTLRNDFLSYANIYLAALKRIGYPEAI
jgi:hypothetical protein